MYSELLPEEKASLVSELQRKGFIVAAVGDGINDAICLSKADVGIAVHRGADLAKEAGDRLKTT